RNLARDPRQWNVVASQGGQRPPVDIPHPRYWNLLAANYVMFRKSQLTPFFEKEYPFLRKVAEDDLTRRVLYENPEAWPRLMFFTRAEVLADDRQFLDRLNEPSFDPRQTLVLAEQPDFDLSVLDGGSPGTARAEITAYRWGRMTVSAECDRPALLYLAEAYHPDWRATVDGRPARIYRAELALRAVYLEPGRHEIELRYESAPYRWGKWITLVALAVSLAWVGWTAYRKDW
ncbi:MAG: YfhO family protein, partial [Candidatus Glassbacteria bacterium]